MQAKSQQVVLSPNRKEQKSGNPFMVHGRYHHGRICIHAGFDRLWAVPRFGNAIKRMQKGKRMKVQMTIPIEFKLDNTIK